MARTIIRPDLRPKPKPVRKLRKEETPEQLLERMAHIMGMNQKLDSGEYGLDQNFNVVSLKDNPKAVPVPHYARNKRRDANN